MKPQRNVVVTAQTPNVSWETGAQNKVASYTVKNESGLTDTYTLNCQPGTSVTCDSPSGTSQLLQSGQSATINTTVDLPLYVNSDQAGLKAQTKWTAITMLNVQPPPVAVTPNSSSQAVLGNTQATAEYTVDYQGTSSVFTAGVVCAGQVSGCSASPSSVTVGPGSPATVTVAFTSGTAPASGTIDLTMTGAGTSDVGRVNVSTIEGAVALANPNTDGETMRGDCLSVAAGPAEIQCGDLRLTVPMLPVATMSQARQLTFVYNSAFVKPRPIVAANVTAAASQANVTAKLKRGQTTVAEHTWAGTGFPVDKTVRIALSYDASGLNTGLDDLTLEVTLDPDQGLTTTTTLPVTVPIVNWKDSDAGEGWQHTANEKLVLGQGTTGNKIMWAGADGSTRIYDNIGTNLWAARRPSLPDTIQKFPTYYRRSPIGGGAVVYTVSGLLYSITDVFGKKTSITWGTVNGKNRVLNIKPPTKTGSITAYELQYNGATEPTVTQVKVRDHAGGMSRITTFGKDGDKVASITAPDGRSTSFTYETDGRVKTIASPRGDTSTVTYESSSTWFQAQKVTGVTTVNGALTATTAYTPFMSLGRTSPVEIDQAFAQVNGPRTDVSDVTKFWLTGWGAPWKIEDALGATTQIERTHTTFTEFVTGVLSPNGLRVTSDYDATTGELLKTTNEDTQAETLYQWDSNFHRVLRSTNAVGVATLRSLDPANGNVLSIRPVDAIGVQHDSMAVTFSYSPTYPGLMTSTDDAKGGRTTITYDGWGNRRSVQFPMGAGSGGYLTTTYKTQVGLDTLIIADIDTNRTQRTKIFYDVMDRDTLRVQTSNDASPDSLFVRTVYDAVGDRVRVERWSRPDPNGIGLIKTEWEYDGFGRVKKEIAFDSVGVEQPVVYTYDQAGNQTAVVTRNGHTITMQYDALNRLTQRVVPQVTTAQVATLNSSQDTVSVYPRYGDSNGALVIPQNTDTYVYDNVGNMIQADNEDAKVRRVYDLSGRLVTDSLLIRNYDRASSATHKYVNTYSYDSIGRRTTMGRPTGFDGVSTDVVSYGYNTVSGQLNLVTDGSMSFTWVHDQAGRPVKATIPGGIVDDRTYDSNGQLRKRIVAGGAAPGSGGFPGQQILDDTLKYDQQGRVLWVDDAGGLSTMTYNGMGAVLTSERLMDTLSFFHALAEPGSLPTSRETNVLDALGNTLTADRDGWSIQGGVFPSESSTYHYEPLTGRLLSRVPFIGGSADAYLYDDAGNRISQGWGNGSDTNGWTRSYYGADGKLRVIDRQGCKVIQLAGGALGCGLMAYNRLSVFEEYRYDALGRRILVRARNDATRCTGNMCPNYIQRTVWDGNQILLEIRRPGADTMSMAALDSTDRGIVSLGATEWICDPNVGVCNFEGNPPGEDDCANAAIMVEVPPGCVEVPLPQDFFPYGVTAYLHGGELDRPLSIRRLDHSTVNPGYIIQPLANWRGDFVTGAYATGAAADCMASSGSCIDMEWPGERIWNGYQNRDDQLTKFGPKHWMGSLVYSGADASGLLYRRNRYYDPVAGQFTQEDPIGLAGGLNLYGYANGDPVNLSDPFGLCASEIAGDTLETRVAHLSERCVDEGDEVEAGQLIGYSGNTGRSTGPHLHYEEVRVREGSPWGNDGIVRLDPLLLLATSGFTPLGGNAVSFYPRINSRFGRRTDPITGQSAGHGGVDVRVPVGTPVYAPFSGVVVRSGTSSSYGEVIYIRHR